MTRRKEQPKDISNYDIEDMTEIDVYYFLLYLIVAASVLLLSSTLLYR